MNLPTPVETMRTLTLIPLLLLSACSTTPKIVVQPLQPSGGTEQKSVRYPEAVRTYHVGRYTDPNNGMVMHEQHVVYRIEENARWDLRPGNSCGVHFPPVSVPRDAAFMAFPVNDAILAEVNSQRLATAQIMGQTKVLSGALQQLQVALQIARTNEQAAAGLRAAMNDLRKRLDALESLKAPASAPDATTNPPPVMPNP